MVVGRSCRVHCTRPAADNTLDEAPSEMYRSEVKRGKARSTIDRLDGRCHKHSEVELKAGRGPLSNVCTVGFCAAKIRNIMQVTVRISGTSPHLYVTPAHTRACRDRIELFRRLATKNPRRLCPRLDWVFVSSRMHETLLVVAEVANTSLVGAYLWVRDLLARCEGKADLLVADNSAS